MSPLSEAGADILARNLKSWAPIHSAANAGHLEAALRLVLAGASWRPGRGPGSTDADVIKMLVRKGGYKVSTGGVTGHAMHAGQNAYGANRHQQADSFLACSPLKGMWVHFHADQPSQAEFACAGNCSFAHISGVQGLGFRVYVVASHSTPKALGTSP